MTTKPRTSTERAFSTTVDAFMELSGVYLDCTEQLTHSTLAVSRAAFEECVAATRHAAVARRATEPAGLPLALGQSLMEKALAYTREGYETVTKAQLESARIIREQFATSAVQFPVADEWKGGLDLFTRALRDFSGRAAAAFNDAGEVARKTPNLNKAA